MVIISNMCGSNNNNNVNCVNIKTENQETTYVYNLGVEETPINTKISDIIQRILT